MASVVRQPFAPLDGARLQTLTSAKNRQNAIPSITSTTTKRKASDSPDIDDSENVDPLFFSKRAKGVDEFFSCKSKHHQPSYKLTKADGDLSFLKDAFATVRTAAPSPRPRAIVKPKAPSGKLAGDARRASLAIPASHSPIRSSSRRGGILSSRRRTSSNITRLDPVSSKVAPVVPFSLDAALKGTLSTYASSTPVAATLPTSTFSSDLSLSGSDTQASWFFDIHEDTPEQEMTNLLQHSTCVLDISSDEECEQKARREKAEGRDKENIPPANDVSQVRRLRSDQNDDMIVEKARNPLSQLNASDYYAVGCDEATVVFVADDAEVEGDDPANCAKTDDVEIPVAANAESSVPSEPVASDSGLTAEQLMTRREDPVGAAVLQPIEGAGESFDVWESGSSKDDSSALDLPPAPLAPAAEI